MEATSLQGAAEVSKDQSEQSNSDIEMRLPDTALRQIFSYLQFNDIASCRLVSTQWHRFALDNMSFVLSLQRDDSTRRSQRIADSADAADNAHNWHVRMTLIPYPARLDWNAGEKKALVTAGRGNPAQIMRLDQVAGAIKKSFQRKIKHVVAKNINTAILSILPDLATMAPTAATICAVNQREATRFIRERQTVNFKCIELDTDSVFVKYKPVGLNLIANNASSIARLSTTNWFSIFFAIVRIEENNNNNNDDDNDEEVVFNNCEKLRLAVAGPAAISFHQMAARFPALRQLDYATDWFGNNSGEMDHLEQLTNLTSLTIRNGLFGSTVLKKLCHPSLVELRLGSGIRFPKEQVDLFLPAVTTLELETNLYNALRLSTIGVPILWNLTSLTMNKLPLEHVKPFLRSILPVTSKLETLTIDLLLNGNHLGRPVLTNIYDTLLVVPNCKTALAIGTFEIFANAVDCGSLVQQRVADIKQRNLKTAITVVFRDNVNNALVKTLNKAGAGGPGVAISTIADDAGTKNYKLFELKWHNDVAGIQQKLNIGVWNYDA